MCYDWGVIIGKHEVEQKSMTHPHIKEHILVVMKGDLLRAELVETLEGAGGYTVSAVPTFESALAEVTMIDFDLIITATQLPDLSGLDLLTAVTRLRPNTSVIIIDEELSAKSAVALFRLGAVDYLYKPLNMSFLLMQVERQMEIRRLQRRHTEPIVAASLPQRAAALTLNRRHFRRIELELNRLLSHVRADFVGLLDAEGNMLGTAGMLHDDASHVLMQGLQVSRSQPTHNTDPTRFPTHQLLQGGIGVYVVQVGRLRGLSLATICPAEVQSSIVWLYSKRTAASIDDFLPVTPPQI